MVLWATRQDSDIEINDSVVNLIDKIRDYYKCKT